MADPRKPTRSEFAKAFGGDPRMIRAFEKLFDIIPDELIDRIDGIDIQAGNADSKAIQAIDSLARIADAVEYLAVAPQEELPMGFVVDHIDFTEAPNHVNVPQRVTWHIEEDCLNVHHKDGVVQQVGQETYMRTENDTGSTIPNGSVVGFAGINGEIKIFPYIADGSASELLFIGVTTQELSDGEIGKTTTYGKVRDIDTTGTPVGETWAKEDFLYASTTIAGALTNVRPTAPDKVIVIAAVLVVSATIGEIMVRPTVPIGLDYGTFSRNTDFSISSINTAFPVEFDTDEVAEGISRGTPTSRIVVSESGLYQVSMSLQVTSSNGSTIVFYSWLRKNGTDIARSRRDFTIKANGDTKVVSTTYQISLLASEYIEIVVASDSTGVFLDYDVATAFAPVRTAALLSMEQIQL